MATSIKFEIYQDKARDFRWRVKARNGKIIGDSAEGYDHKSGCEKSIERFVVEFTPAGFFSFLWPHIASNIVDLTKTKRR